jgi:outer membrane protein OmpA-like peptidoglycan-associated protein
MGTFSAAYAFLHWLEVYGSYEVSSSFATMTLSSGMSSSVSGQILGDTNLGAKLTHGFVPSFYAGLDLGLRLFNVGNTSNNLRLAFRPSALLTLNIQRLSPYVPLVLHSNLGVHVDLGRDTGLFENNAARDIWKTFSWNLNNRHYGFFSLALEAPLPCVTPFVEYQASFPFWTQKDNALAKANPQSLVVGAKLTLLPNVTFTLGGDINLKSPHIPGVTFYPPWRFFIGISLATAPSSSVPAPSTATRGQTSAAGLEEEPGEPLPPQLVLALKRGNQFVPGQVYLRGPNPQRFYLAETTPSFNLPPGPQLLEILPAEGLAKVKKIHLSPGQAQTLVLDIESAPANAPVRRLPQRILFAEPLAFSLSKMELTPFGQAQLRSLVDLLLRNHIRKIRIESHVESQQIEGSAMPLSAQRSQMVVDALVELGIGPERMEVLNLGDTKPVAPNTVRRGRLLNRRMDFVVLEKWE